MIHSVSRKWNFTLDHPDIDVTPEIEDLEEMWCVGGKEQAGWAAQEILELEGYDKYIASIREALREQLGEYFRAYCVLSEKDLIEIRQIGDTDAMAFTTSLDLAQWRCDDGMIIVRTVLSPENVIMRGQDTDFEVVVLHVAEEGIVPLGQSAEAVSSEK